MSELPSEFDAASMRAWCIAMSRTLQVERIIRDGTPYLDRYFLNRRHGPAAFLHHFLASDPDDSLHSHPWDYSLSLILIGGYREERCTGAGPIEIRAYHPGDLNILRAKDTHRIDLLERDCWSLFLAGTFQQMWGFTPRDACG